MENGFSPQGLFQPSVELFNNRLQKAVYGAEAFDPQNQGPLHSGDLFGELTPKLEAESHKTPQIEAPLPDDLIHGIEPVEFLGLKFHQMPQDKAVGLILKLAKSEQSYRVYFANANSIEISRRDTALLDSLNRCNLLLADGSGVLWGSKLMGKPLKYNLNGTDLVPALCDSGREAGISFFFLGAKPGVAKRASENLASRFPGMKVAGTRDGYFNDDEVSDVIQNVLDAKPDVLLLAMGTPLQEIWIDRYASQLPGITCIAVGGLFDFMAGDVARAPLVFRKLGFEWLWRLVMEPKRLWRRYVVGNLTYLYLLSKAWGQLVLRRFQVSP